MSQYSSSNSHSYSRGPPTYGYPPNSMPAIPPPPPPMPKGNSDYRGSHSHRSTDYRYHPYQSHTPLPYSTPYQSQSHSHSHSRYAASTNNLSRTPLLSSQSKYSKYSRSDSSMKPRKSKPPRNEFGIPFGQPGAGLHAPDWAHIQLPVFQKNFYRESSQITQMTDSEVTQWRKERDIEIMGDKVPRPIRTFEEAGFPSYIMTEIRRAGFVKPTPIQSQGWPMAMTGRDVIGIAETGSGKTLAFLLPCIVHINAQPLLRPGDGPIVLIVAPTRELAIQIENEVSKFAYSSKIKHCCVYGGVSRRDQIRNLRQGVEIIICTPGRLLDFLESSQTNLKRVTYLVIDEADRLLDMGFEPQLTSILSQVRPDRQILMWSATWPKEVRELSGKYFKNRSDVIQVSVGQPMGSGGEGAELRANPNVKQIVHCFDSNYEKQDRLYKILQCEENRTRKKFLIFSSTKKQCDYLYKLMKSDGYKVAVIHGDKQQYERDSALASFKNGSNNLMIATDVASRGIHINDIYMVINYDFPQNIEDYVHRIGRTGRCGKKGTAISFFTQNDVKRAHKLINILKGSKQEIPKELVRYSQMSHSMGGRTHQRYSNSRYGSR